MAAIARTVLALALCAIPRAAIAQQKNQNPLWSGFYIMGAGGQVNASTDGTLFHNDPTAPGVTAQTMFGAGADQSFSPKGGVGGLVAGYNWQWESPLVLGIEASISWAGAPGDQAVTSTDTLTTWALETRLYSLGTLQARAGFATGPVLWYGTAGMAWGLVDTKNTVTSAGCPTPCAEGEGKASHVGFIGGGGVEWLVGQYIVLRGEYLFADLGTAKHNFNGTAATGTTPDPANPGKFIYDWDGIDQKMSFQMWRVGVGLKFN